jgi:membrane protein YdbS with pleckstrin-like domain
MRTGIAVLALPLSITSVLIATSKYYEALQVLHFLIPLGILNLAMIVFGIFLIVRSVIRMRHYDLLIHEIKMKHSVIGRFIE